MICVHLLPHSLWNQIPSSWFCLKCPRVLLRFDPLRTPACQCCVFPLLCSRMDRCSCFYQRRYWDISAATFGSQAKRLRRGSSLPLCRARPVSVICQSFRCGPRRPCFDLERLTPACLLSFVEMVSQPHQRDVRTSKQFIWAAWNVASELREAGNRLFQLVGSRINPGN